MAPANLAYSQTLQRFFSNSPEKLRCVFVSSGKYSDVEIVRYLYGNHRMIDQTTGKDITLVFMTNLSSNQGADSTTGRANNTTQASRSVDDNYKALLESNFPASRQISQYHQLQSSQLPALLFYESASRPPKIFSIGRIESLKRFFDQLSLFRSFLDNYRSLINDNSGNRAIRENPYDTNINMTNQGANRQDNDLNRLEENLVKYYGIESERRFQIPSYVVIPHLKRIAQKGRVDMEVVDWMTTECTNHGNSDNSNTGGDQTHTPEPSGGGNSPADRLTKYDIFISCRSTDYSLGNAVYRFLVARGFKVFIADQELRRLGVSLYGSVIDYALDHAKHLIVIASQKEYLYQETSPYVFYEWSSFLEEVKSRRKAGANILTLRTPNIEIGDLPYALRHQQSFTYAEYERVLDYLR